MSKYNKDMEKIVKKMGYTSYYVKKISSIKGKKNKEKYLFKLLTKYGKFHNLKCDLKCISIKQKYQSGGAKMNALASLAFLERGLKSLNEIQNFDRIKIKGLANDKKNLQNNIERLDEFNKKKEKKIEEKIEEIKKEKTILQTEKKDLADKNTLSISKIKELKDYKLRLITSLLLLLQTKLYLFQQIFNPYKDLITLLVLLKKEAQSQGIAKKTKGFNERFNERLDFYTIKVSDLEKTLYNGFYLKCQLFKKFGIPIITADFDAIEITDGNYLGWKDNNLDTIIYKKKGGYVNANGTTIKHTKVTAPENINISTFDTIYTDIDVLDDIVDKLDKSKLKEKLILIINEGLNIINGCACTSECNYKYEGKTQHWCEIIDSKCKRGEQFEDATTIWNALGSAMGRKSSKTCNPREDNYKTPPEKIDISDINDQEYYIGTHPYASPGSDNLKIRKFCIQDKDDKISISPKKKGCKEWSLTLSTKSKKSFLGMRDSLYDKEFKKIGPVISDIIRELNKP